MSASTRAPWRSIAPLLGLLLWGVTSCKKDPLPQLLGIDPGFETSYQLMATERIDSKGVARTLARVKVPQGLTARHLDANLRHAIGQIHGQAGVALGAVRIDAYGWEPAKGAYTAGQAVFSPNGQWDGADLKTPLEHWRVRIHILPDYLAGRKRGEPQAQKPPPEPSKVDAGAPAADAGASPVDGGKTPSVAGPTGNVTVTMVDLKGKPMSVNVWLPGRPLGTTPWTGDLPVGRHKVHAGPRFRTVTVEAGKSQTVAFAQPPPPPVLDTGKLPKHAIRAGIGRELSGIRNCYEKQLKNNELLRGKVVVDFRIEPSGSATGVKIKRSELNDATAHRCILAHFRRMKFKKPEGGAVLVSYPLTFKPRLQ